MCIIINCWVECSFNVSWIKLADRLVLFYGFSDFLPMSVTERMVLESLTLIVSLSIAFCFVYFEALLLVQTHLEFCPCSEMNPVSL